MNKPYLWAVEYTVSFFSISYQCFDFILSFFNANLQNSFEDVVYYRILGCQTL